MTRRARIRCCQSRVRRWWRRWRCLGLVRRACPQIPLMSSLDQWAVLPSVLGRRLQAIVAGSHCGRNAKSESTGEKSLRKRSRRQRRGGKSWRRRVRLPAQNWEPKNSLLKRNSMSLFWKTREILRQLALSVQLIQSVTSKRW